MQQVNAEFLEIVGRVRLSEDSSQPDVYILSYARLLDVDIDVFPFCGFCPPPPEFKAANTHTRIQSVCRRTALTMDLCRMWTVDKALRQVSHHAWHNVWTSTLAP